MSENNNDYKTIENLLNSIEHFDKDMLKETLAYVLKVYVLDKGLQYDGDIKDNISKTNYNINQFSKNKTFIDLITGIKRNYSFKELENFIIEGDKVYFQINNTKHLITKKENKDSTQTPSDPFEKKTKNENNIKPNLSHDRFKNLEIDK